VKAWTDEEVARIREIIEREFKVEVTCAATCR